MHASEYDVRDLEEPYYYKERQAQDCAGQPNSSLMGCCIHKNFVRPPLSEIWVPAYLLDKSLIPGFNPKTLDEYDGEPKFSIIDPIYLNTVPDGVKAFLSSNSANPVNTISEICQESPSSSTESPSSSTESPLSSTESPSSSTEYPSSSKESPLSSTESPSSSTEYPSSSIESSSNSSRENLKSGEDIDCGSNQIVYEGEPTSYQKKNSDEIQTNGKKIKKSRKKNQNKLKMHNTSESVLLKEMENPMDIVTGNSVSTYKPKSYSLNIMKSKRDGFGTLVKNDVCGDLEEEPVTTHPFVVDHFKRSAFVEPKLGLDSVIDFPNLVVANQESSVVIPDAIQEDFESAVISIPKKECKKENGGVILVAIISAKIDRQDLQEFLGSFSKIDIIKEEVIDGKRSIEFTTDIDSSWLVDCINGEQPFGANTEPFQCFVKTKNDLGSNTSCYSYQRKWMNIPV